MRKLDRILKKDRVRAERRRRKAAVFILGFHRMVFTPASIRSSLAMKQLDHVEPVQDERRAGSLWPTFRIWRKPLDPKLPWWRQPSSHETVNAFRKRMGYDRPDSYSELLLITRHYGGEPLKLEMEMLSRTWEKPTKGVLKRRRKTTAAMVLVGGGMLSALLAYGLYSKP